MPVVEVFADVTCPFTHVGLRRFVARRDELGRSDVVLRVRSWPLEVVNGEPLDAHFVADEVEHLREQAAADLFAGFTEASFPATAMPALALAAAANALDDDTGERVSLALRWRLFEEGADIADPGVLQALAAEHGVDWGDVDESRVHADHAEGVERDVIGSPHFFTPAGDFFCPGLEISRGADGELHVEPKVAVFDAFLTACFG